ncbi:flagellar motor switch protein FliN/FliY [Rhizobium sp. PP-F2F-G48]|uniref:flagellar motor switch protein FliN n=1 Tax=Rhizobium sp. PP-F2F-G48 TaxID=2135651 RepID=UPI00104A9598|nr:flagellar motor switch protein FliN [Rhizobium sp. PP-F2F-G48]TCM56038.1 flagellar motor switch protein FliN/FliY [Rhizobium sp. PP-F2F-G48]
MAPRKAPITEDMSAGAGDAELDQAIDDLRGVLKTDAEGGLPDTGFDMDFGAAPAAEPDFMSDFGAVSQDEDPFAGTFSEPTAFADTAFGGGEDAFEDSFATPSATAGATMHGNLDLIMDIPIDVQIVLGSSRMQVSGLMGLTEGATIALDRKIGEPVEIMVNGRVIGRGEITVLEEDDTRFGVRLIEVNSGKKA